MTWRLGVSSAPVTSTTTNIWHSLSVRAAAASGLSPLVPTGPHWSPLVLPVLVEDGRSRDSSCRPEEVLFTPPLGLSAEFLINYWADFQESRWSDGTWAKKGAITFWSGSFFFFFAVDAFTNFKGNNALILTKCKLACWGCIPPPTRAACLHSFFQTHIRSQWPLTTQKHNALRELMSECESFGDWIQGDCWICPTWEVWQNWAPQATCVQQRKPKMCEWSVSQCWIRHWNKNQPNQIRKKKIKGLSLNLHSVLDSSISSIRCGCSSQGGGGAYGSNPHQNIHHVMCWHLYTGWCHSSYTGVSENHLAKEQRK